MSDQPTPVAEPTPGTVSDAVMSPLQNPAFWSALATVVSVILIYLVPSLQTHADSIVAIITALGGIVTASLGAAHVKGAPHGSTPAA